MVRKAIFLVFFLLSLGSATRAQEPEPASWNFNIGGGVGFPLKDTSTFVDNGANLVIGAGYNFRPALAVNTEFMWQNLPPKRSILDQIGAPDGFCRCQFAN
jgi:hypothetical protein